MSKYQFSFNYLGYVMDCIAREKERGYIVHHSKEYTAGRIFESLGCGSVLLNYKSNKIIAIHIL